MTDDDALLATATIDQVWTFFKNEQKINKKLRKQVQELTHELQAIATLEKSVRDMDIENNRLRAEVKRLRAIHAALGEQQ